MKLAHPGEMTPRQALAYRLCLASSGRPIDREEALACMMNHPGAIEEGLSIIGRGLPIPGLGAVDLIAKDRKERLIVAGWCERLDAKALTRAIRQGDWARDHLELVEYMFSQRFPGAEVRIWQMVQEVNAEGEALLRRMGSGEVEVLMCEALVISQEKWLILRRYHPAEGPRQSACGADGGGRALKPPVAEQGRDCLQRDSHVVSRPNMQTLHSVLTKEEVDDFFSVARDDEETTFKGAFFSE